MGRRFDIHLEHKTGVIREILHAISFEIYIIWIHHLSPMKFAFLAFKKGCCQQVNHVLTSVGKLSSLKRQM
jgi:hypothetical protein